jgi:hypothetical protein
MAPSPMTATVLIPGHLLGRPPGARAAGHPT